MLSARALQIQDILEDTLSNIVLQTALSCHRAEKLLRMQSAATQAESIALAALEPASQKAGATSQPAIPVAETSAAKYENGRVLLKGNPLKTTPEIICPHCKLPRLMHPIMGKGMQNPDLTKEYCLLYPWVQRSGHDVYGNPFPTDMAKSKKERELIKQQQKNADKEQEAAQTYEKGIQVAESVASGKAPQDPHNPNPDPARAKAGAAQMATSEGNIYVKMNKNDEAIASYKKATEIDPSSATAFYNLCAVQFNGGKFDDAAAACDKSIAADPNKADAWFFKGAALAKAGKPGANDALNKYLQLDPSGTHTVEAKTLLAQQK